MYNLVYDFYINFSPHWFFRIIENVFTRTSLRFPSFLIFIYGGMGKESFLKTFSSTIVHHSSTDGETILSVPKSQ